MASLPNDYIERVYAGVLGKLIGVYIGRPFEGWTHQRIMKELGPIRYYVHEQLGHPLVVTDDDVSGTFVFVRALEEHEEAWEHEATEPLRLTADHIGRTWLNNVVEERSVFWWGGLGISTEHTAYLNLRRGIPAPASGSIATNGRTVSEQIGAQIFIDAWAMVAPGNPALAAGLAGAAGAVSHDGESVYAAQLWAAMEAEAFVSRDVDHLLDTGLRYIPPDCAIARMVAEVRQWTASDGSWTITRQRIEDAYGYDKYEGCCHVMPNHGIMIMALLYAGASSFHEALHIINTCGWDTDCNSGNVGCLVAIMHGMDAFAAGPDWRSPLADRALISSADGGYSINNAARMALDVSALGYRLAGRPPPPPPKNGAQFHFTLPGSVQGFRVMSGGHARLEQGADERDGRLGLRISLDASLQSASPAEVLTDTFAPKEVDSMGPIYPLMASPLVYPGQKVYAVVRSGAAAGHGTTINCRLRLKHYGRNDELVTVDGPRVRLGPADAPADAGAFCSLEWTIPDDFDGQPIQQLGLALWLDTPENLTLSPTTSSPPTVWLDRLGWTGTPSTVFKRPAAEPTTFWTRAWINSLDVFHRFMQPSFHLAKNGAGQEGQLVIGTREWTDYDVTASRFKATFGSWAGVAVRVRGLNRYYAAVLARDDIRGGRLALVKAHDAVRQELVSAPFAWALDREYEVVVRVAGSTISASIGNDVRVEVVDVKSPIWMSGGAGFVLREASLSCNSFRVASTE